VTLAVPDRDGLDVHALVADRYLEALLSAGDRRADDVPADPSLDPALREAARILRAALVRVHPSFRFEERLARRLAALAAAQARGAGAAPGVLIPFAPGRTPLGAIDPDLQAVLDGHLDPAASAASPDTDTDPIAVARAAGPLGGRRRPVLVGSAVASAVLSVVGVVIVAWRAARPGPGPMVRAARIVHGRRLAAAAADLAGGIGAGRPA
jgi:hypothetical protein